jgi:hypothetical protein
MLKRDSYRDGLLERLVAALRLDVNVYRLVSSDPAASSQAFRVVLLAGASNGLGLARRLGGVGVVAGVGAAILGWLLWAGVIGATATLLGHRRTGGSLLRALGFANSPGVFLILGAIPVLGAVSRTIVVVWLLAATVRAVEAVFAVAPRRASIVSVAAFVAYLVLGLVSAHFASP